MAVVYWIYRKDIHTDPFLHGYVGVTTKTASQRVSEHYKDYMVAKGRQQHLKPLHRLIERFGYAGIDVLVLFEGTEDECYKKEREYRPTEYTGLNIAKGGKYGYYNALDNK